MLVNQDTYDILTKYLENLDYRNLSFGNISNYSKWISVIYQKKYFYITSYSENHIKDTFLYKTFDIAIALKDRKKDIYFLCLRVFLFADSVFFCCFSFSKTNDYANDSFLYVFALFFCYLCNK